MIKVIIADDQELIRESLKMVLNSKEDIEVVATAENGQELIKKIREVEVDVILLDIRMPKIDGVQCTKIIKEFRSHIKIVILTTFDDDTYISEAIKNGAEGYLLKGESIDQIVTAIRDVYEGGNSINKQVASKLIKMYSDLAKNHVEVEADEKIISEITKTEWKIIREVEKGSSNKEISKNLHLSEGTVRNYLSAILGKLDLRDRTQVAIWALQHKNRGLEDDKES